MNRCTAFVLNCWKYRKWWEITKFLLWLIVLWICYDHCLILTVYSQLHNYLISLITVIKCASNKKRLLLFSVWYSNSNTCSLTFIIWTFLWVQNNSPSMNTKCQRIWTINNTLFVKLKRILARWFHSITLLYEKSRGV